MFCTDILGTGVLVPHGSFRSRNLISCIFFVAERCFVSCVSIQRCEFSALCLVYAFI